MILKSEKQKKLFEEITKCGELIFACGPEGVSANIVGKFHVRRYGDEDRLDMGDGTNHVHIDWANIGRVESGSYHGEGMLTFFKGDKVMFKLYRPAGEFPHEVVRLMGDLV